MKKYRDLGKEKIKNSTWLLAFYLVLMPLDFYSVIPSVSISRFLIFLPLFACLFYIKEMRIQLDKFFITPVLYVMIIMISMFYSCDLPATLQRTITTSLNVAIIIIMSMLNYNKLEIRTLKKAISLSGWLTVLLMLPFVKMGKRLTIHISGATQDPNYLVGYLLFAIIYYLDQFMDEKKLTSLIKTMTFLLFALLTGSRGGALAVLGSMLFYVLSFVKTKRDKLSSRIQVMIAFIIIGMCLTFIINNVLPDTIAQRYDRSFTIEDRGANRWQIWESILYNYKNSSLFHKIFGMGSGTIAHFTFAGFVGHNLWIESLMEIGFFGVAILFMFYFMYFVKAYRMEEYVICSSFVGYMIMTLSMSLYSYKPIWNIILLIMIIKNRRKDDEKKVNF